MIIESFIADFLKPEAKMKQLQHVLFRTWEQRCHLFTLRKKKRTKKKKTAQTKCYTWKTRNWEEWYWKILNWLLLKRVRNKSPHDEVVQDLFFFPQKYEKRKWNEEKTESAKFRKVASPWREDQTPLSNNKDLLKDLSEPLNSGLHRAIKYHP